MTINHDTAKQMYPVKCINTLMVALKAVVMVESLVAMMVVWMVAMMVALQDERWAEMTAGLWVDQMGALFMTMEVSMTMLVTQVTIV